MKTIINTNYAKNIVTANSLFITDVTTAASSDATIELCGSLDSEDFTILVKKFIYTIQDDETIEVCMEINPLFNDYGEPTNVAIAYYIGKNPTIYTKTYGLMNFNLLIRDKLNVLYNYYDLCTQIYY